MEQAGAADALEHVIGEREHPSLLDIAIGGRRRFHHRAGQRLHELVEALFGDRGDKEREGEYTDVEQRGEYNIQGLVAHHAPERAKKARRAAAQEHAHQRQQHGIEHQRKTMRPGGGDIVVGQIHDLDKEDHHHRHADDGEPEHAVQEAAEQGRALGAGQGLGEEIGIQLVPDGMGAPRAGLHGAHGGIELHDFAGQHDVLHQQAEMHEQQHDRGEQEETREVDRDLHERQLHGRIQQQVLVRHAGRRDAEIGHDAEEDDPAGMGDFAGVVDGFDEAEGIDLGQAGAGRVAIKIVSAGKRRGRKA